MKKTELKELNSQLIDAHTKTQQAWAMVRILAHAAQNNEPPPTWAVRDTCSAIEDYLGEISGLLYECGHKIEGEF
jgi:hypothetical protein